MSDSYSICPKCGQYSPGGMCSKCLSEERQVAQNIEATLSIQEQMLRTQREMAEEQRLFHQKILEQAISKEEAYENGGNYEFKDGDIKFSEDGFEFNINSPYVTEKLRNSFFEGVKHNFNNHFPAIDWSDISNQVAKIAIDFRSYLEEQINLNPPGPRFSRQGFEMPAFGINPATGKFWTSGEIKIKQHGDPNDTKGYETRFYKIIKKSNINEKNYCLHLLCVNFKLDWACTVYPDDRNRYIDLSKYGQGEIIVEGIESAYIKNSSLWKVFNDSLDLVNLLSKLNEDRVSKKNDSGKKENSTREIIFFIVILLIVAYLYITTR